jgi:hypothetical protein
MRLGICVVFLLCSLVACNLGANNNPTPQSIATVTPLGQAPVGSKPSVVVNSPASGETFPVNLPIIVNATASDATGVTRLQLFANGSPVKTVSSVSAAGDPTLSALLDYTPRAVGTVNLRVLAYRGAIASDPVDLQVIVGNATSPTAIPLPDSSGGNNTVTIPQDGVCRVLTTSSVNFRLAPTTTQGNNIIRTLAASTLAQVVARLADNSWWKININGTVGWVSAQFVTLTGNCLNIPIESPLTTPTPTATTAPILPTATRTPSAPTNTPRPLLPDLIVTNIFPTTNVVLSGGTAIQTYSVTITNNGAGPATQFSANLSVNNGTPIDLGTVGSLEQGQSVVLQTTVTYTSTGTFNLRVDVDSANAVQEVSEINNRGDISVTVTN